MPNFYETTDIVRRYVKARVPLIVITSIEPNRVLDILAAVAAEVGTMPFFSHSRTEGLKDLLGDRSVSDDHSLTGGLDHAGTTFKTRANANFIFTDVEDLGQESSTARHFAEVVRLAESRQGSIILINSGPVWSGLSRLGMTVSLDLPTTDELLEVIGAFVDDHRQVVSVEWQHEQVRSAAEIMSGITEMEAINVLATLLAKGSLKNSDVSEISTFKDRIFGELSGIERVRLDEDYQVGGLQNLRKWLRTREDLMKSDLSQTRLRPPKGVLLVGVPGCGKSLSAKAIASDWNLPLYRLDMAGILGMYVGQSESQFREALETADRVAPCVLWIDEIEKALASDSGGSGTSRRLIGQFLFWLQESRSKVFLVATANDVSSLPPELLRKGRFDEMFFVDLPDASDREEILKLYFDRYFEFEPAPDLMDALVRASEGFSGSDIDAVVHEIATAVHTSRMTDMPIDEAIMQFFEAVIPYSKTNAEDVAAIRQWGRGRAVPANISVEPDLPDQPQSRRVVIL